MVELTEKEKIKALKILDVLGDGDLALLKEVLKLGDRLDEMSALAKGEKGDQGDAGDTPQKNKDYFDGENYVLTENDKKEIALKIKVPVVEKVIERTEVIREQPIVTNEIKEVAIQESPEQVVIKLESLSGDARLDKSAIKGLDEALEKVSKSQSVRVVGGRSNNAMKAYDLSSQTNGVLKVFTVPKNITGVVFSSDFPTPLMEGNGLTLNGTRTQLTLTVANAPSQGSQLLFLYSSIFNT